MTRHQELDIVRGVAVLAMVAYHLAFDLDYLGVASIPVTDGWWRIFARSIAITFLLIVGISVHISKARPRPYRDYLIRGAKIAAFGLGITLATWLIVPQEFIFFGILHLIGVSVMLAPWFQPLGLWNLPVASVFITFGLFLQEQAVSWPWLAWAGLPYYGMATLDWFPLLPWLGVVLIGLAIGSFLYPRGKARWKARMRAVETAPAKALAWIGRKSFIVYLVHQPALIAIILLATGKLGEFIQAFV